MRKMPCCPRCSEDELWLKQTPMYAILSCYECGWQAILTPPLANKDLSREIAATVDAAKPHDDDAGAGA